MPTQCNTKPLEFEAHGRRRVVLLSTPFPSFQGGLGMVLVTGSKSLQIQG